MQGHRASFVFNESLIRAVLISILFAIVATKARAKPLIPGDGDGNGSFDRRPYFTYSLRTENSIDEAKVATLLRVIDYIEKSRIAPLRLELAVSDHKPDITIWLSTSLDDSSRRIRRSLELKGIRTRFSNDVVTYISDESALPGVTTSILWDKIGSSMSVGGLLLPKRPLEFDLLQIVLREVYLRSTYYLQLGQLDARRATQSAVELFDYSTEFQVRGQSRAILTRLLGRHLAAGVNPAQFLYLSELLKEEAAPFGDLSQAVAKLKTESSGFCEIVFAKIL